MIRIFVKILDTKKEREKLHSTNQFYKINSIFCVVTRSDYF